MSSTEFKMPDMFQTRRIKIQSHSIEVLLAKTSIFSTWTSTKLQINLLKPKYKVFEWQLQENFDTEYANKKKNLTKDLAGFAL